MTETSIPSDDSIRNGYVCHPSREIVALGPSIGRYQGRDIPAWFRTGDGRLHDYCGVAGLMPDLNALKPGQSVIAPGLIYELRVAGGPAG